MQPNLWLGLHSALWVIRDHVVCLACWKIALRPNPLLSAFHPPPPYFSLLILSLVLPNEPVSCQESAQINKHGSHTSGSESSESLYIAVLHVRHLEMCLCAQNSIRGSRQWSTLWFVLWNLLDEWLMPPGKCPWFTITKTMALDTEHRSLGFHTDRSSGCCFLLNPKCWLPIHATSPEHTDAHKGNSQLTRWLAAKKQQLLSSLIVHNFSIVEHQEAFPFLGI